MVSDRVVASTLSQVYEDYHGYQLGYIHSRFYIAQDDKLRDDVKMIIDMTIEVLVNNIKTEIGMEENNKKLSIWNTVLGTHNEHGLLPHSFIKINNRRPKALQFNMNY